ncbi:MAG: cupin domain-containing protein [Candidatus Dormibacteraceae bacterium]
MEHQAERGYRTPLHVHRQDDETLVALYGTVGLRAGVAEYTIGSGETVYLPRGIPHAFIVSSRTARLLTCHTPAGFDQLVRQLGIPAAHDWAGLPGEAIDILASVEVNRRFGIEVVGPPLPLPSPPATIGPTS